MALFYLVLWRVKNLKIKTNLSAGGHHKTSRYRLSATILQPSVKITKFRKLRKFENLWCFSPFLCLPKGESELGI
jgi:hypothetical protein